MPIVQRVCAICNKEFLAPRHRVEKGQAKCCSVACTGALNSKQVTKSCLICGKEFQVSLSKHESGIGLYCSKPCYAEARKNRVKMTCLQCGETFELQQCKVDAGKGKYCSKECSNVAQKGSGNANFSSIKQSCEFCSEEFFVHPSRIKYGGGKYCSDLCRIAGSRTRIEKQCLVCGRSIMVRPYDLETGGGKYCSVECRVKGIRKPREVRACAYCHECFEFMPRPDRKGKREGIFCSRECKKKASTGPGHYNWSGGSPTSRGKGWRKISAKVRKRDGYTCQKCGKKEDESEPVFDVHHIVPFRNFDNHRQANKLSNLITLCAACHMAEERKISEKQMLMFDGLNGTINRGKSVERKCLTCGKKFMVFMSAVRAGAGWYCSRACHYGKNRKHEPELNLA